jgi:parallel beta-helix repeat protein
MRLSFGVAILVACACAAAPSAARAARYFVRTSGSDAANGQTPAAAWRTIGRATELLLPGDEAVVGPGVYPEQNLKVRLSGGPSGHIGLRGDPSGVLTGDPAGPVNINVAGGASAFTISARSYIDLGGFTITNSANAGIYVIAGRNEDGNAVASDHVTVANCTFHSNLGKAIIVRGASNTLIFNNLVYANAGGGVSVGFKGVASPSTQIINNTFYRNVGLTGFGNAISIGGGAPAPQALVLNNVTVGNHKGIVVSRDPATASTYVGLYNLVTDGYSGAARPALNDINADPLFVDPDGPDNVLGGAGAADDDFHLAIGASPAIDTGSDTSGGLALNDASTRVDGGKDSGQVDRGYHYRNDTLAPKRLSVETFLYVRQTGSDANSGRSPGEALRTIGAAAVRAVPGDIVVVGPGTYFERDLKPKRSGASDLARIIFLGDASGSRTFDAPGPVLIDATGERSAFRVTRRNFVTVTGFRVRGANQAGLILGPGQGLVATNNIVFSNVGQGLQAIDAPGVMLVNNLVYANGGTGIFIGGSVSGTRGAVVTHNTVYGNNRGGIRLGTARFPAPGALVVYNVLRANRVLLPLNRPNGFRVTSASRSGLTMGFNLNSDSYQGVGQPATDIVGDPLFVDPDGGDGILGGVAAADDDFRLSSINAGDIANSLALDAGLDCSSRTGLVFTGFTTTRDDARDDRAVDLGFHYILPAACAGQKRCTVGVLRTPTVPPLQRCR